MFKKLLLVAAVVSLSGCAVYTRHGSVQVDPVIVAPAPVIVAPSPVIVAPIYRPYYGYPYRGPHSYYGPQYHYNHR